MDSVKVKKQNVREKLTVIEYKGTKSLPTDLKTIFSCTYREFQIGLVRMTYF